MGLFIFSFNIMPAPNTPQEIEELAITYAALILHDDNLPITEENLTSVLNAANVKVQAFWPRVFAKILEGRVSSQIDDIILGGGAAPAVAAPGTGQSTNDTPAEEEKPVEEEEEEESDEDMGFGLFD